MEAVGRSVYDVDGPSGVRLGGDDYVAGTSTEDIRRRDAAALGHGPLTETCFESIWETVLEKSDRPLYRHRASLTRQEYRRTIHDCHRLAVRQESCV
jgi:hypothetical protein